MSKTIRVLNNENLKAIIAIVAIVGLILGLFFGISMFFNISIRVVESGSMCIAYGKECDGLLALNHPFNGTLHTGDIIIIQRIDASQLNVNYPNSDIIVYRNPAHPEETPIVHRVVTGYQLNGTLYFQTKGDGNGAPWPAAVDPSEYDSVWQTGRGVPADNIEGKVILRIPYFGWITLIFNRYPWLVPTVIGLILLLIVLQFVIPAIRKGKITRKPIEEAP